jgi:hypothetical protein
MTPGDAAMHAVEAAGVARLMRESLWLYPAVEVAHITGIAVLVGSIAMFDVRLLGVGRALAVRALSGFLLPWTLGALLLIVPSGLMMFSAHAADFIDNPAFKFKLALLFCAGINGAMFRTGVYQRVAAWDVGVAPPRAARAQALLSLLLWVGVITCGRLIAYT